MPRKFRSFTDAFTAPHKPTPVAANDNKPRNKQPEPRYRGTLPALRWLYDNHPELAEPVAEAVRSLGKTNWRADAVDDIIEMRPLPSELVAAATSSIETDAEGRETRIWHDFFIEPKPAGATYKDDEWITIGELRFNRGVLVQWGMTKKSRKLRPVERVVSRKSDRPSPRSPKRYLTTRPTTPSPLQAAPLTRNAANAPALASMYDPLPRTRPNAGDRHGRFGVEEGRALLRSFGVDGSVPFEKLGCPAEKGEKAVAKGAEFIGGVSRSSGNASPGAPEMWEGPEDRKGETRLVIEAVAARANLKDIGARLGYSDARATAIGKDALIDAAKTLIAANDKKKKKIAA